MKHLLKKPSAWVPMAISIFMLLVMAVYYIKGGGVIVREPDEGVGAHLFQILMPVQAVIILFFVGKWLPKYPSQAIVIFFIQLFLAFCVIFPVYYFQL